jgi:hypothetical protein
MMAFLPPPVPPPVAASFAPAPPTKLDLEFAQARQIHRVTGVGSNGMVHCNRFRSYRTHPTPDPSTFQVTYREYRKAGPWAKMKAVLRREGDEWLWVDGDPPKCSIMIFE